MWAFNQKVAVYEPLKHVPPRFTKEKNSKSSIYPWIITARKRDETEKQNSHYLKGVLDVSPNFLNARTTLDLTTTMFAVLFIHYFWKGWLHTADKNKRNKNNFLVLYLLCFVGHFTLNHQSVLQTFLISLIVENKQNMFLEHYVLLRELFFQICCIAWLFPIQALFFPQSGAVYFEEDSNPSFSGSLNVLTTERDFSSFTCFLTDPWKLCLIRSIKKKSVCYPCLWKLV